MGMYDYLGSEQVKVFSVPLVNVSSHDSDLNNVKCHYGYSGGRLNGYGKKSPVPYKTSFYNYGPNFIVFDYRGFIEEDEELLMHVIENGCFKKSYPIDSIPKSLKITRVVDNYGRSLNIANISDFLDCHQEHVEAQNLHQELKKKYCEAENIPWRLPHISEFKEMSKEEQENFFKKYDVCSQKAYDDSLKVFVDKWFADENCEDLTYIGALLDEMKSGTRPEWVWYPICKDYVQTIANKDFGSLENAINKYCEWCAAYNVECDATNIKNIFDKYLGEAPQDVIEAYKKTDYYERCIWWYNRENK